MTQVIASSIILLIIVISDAINSLQLYFRECPVFYEEPCNSDSVKFLYLKNSLNESYIREFTLKNTPKEINRLTPLKILIHGYGGLGIDYAIKNVSAAYLSIGYDVILVDWGFLSALPCYTTAYLNTWHVGKCVAMLTVSLLPLGITQKSLHLIGFSLGAHIAGFAGNSLKATSQHLPGRITGLDPALPFFATLNNDWKLDKTDAEFVDIVHTSAGLFGKIEAVGHVDFYVNGGTLQPFCQNAPYPPLCSHVMAGIYFAESVRNKRNFSGVQCENLANYVFGFCKGRARANMGEFVDKKSRGSFFVVTASSPPFPLGYY